MPRSRHHGDRTIPGRERTHVLIQQWGLRTQSVMTCRRLTVTRPHSTGSCAPLHHAGWRIRGLETSKSTRSVEPDWCRWVYIAYRMTSTPYQSCLELTGLPTANSNVFPSLWTMAPTHDRATACDGHGAGPSSATPRMPAYPADETPVYVISGNQVEALECEIPRTEALLYEHNSRTRENSRVWLLAGLCMSLHPEVLQYPPTPTHHHPHPPGPSVFNKWRNPVLRWSVDGAETSPVGTWQFCYSCKVHSTYAMAWTGHHGPHLCLGTRGDQ